jgi:hypothetical protein
MSKEMNRSLAFVQLSRRCFTAVRLQVVPVHPNLTNAVGGSTYLNFHRWSYLSGNHSSLSF